MMLSTLLQCCIVIVMQIKLTVVIVVVATCVGEVLVCEGVDSRGTTISFLFFVVVRSLH